MVASVFNGFIMKYIDALLSEVCNVQCPSQEIGQAMPSYFQFHCNSKMLYYQNVITHLPHSMNHSIFLH